MPSYQIDGLTVVDLSAFVRTWTAVLIGDVIIGLVATSGPAPALRAATSAASCLKPAQRAGQLRATSFPNHEMVVETNGHIGHGAVLHGAAMRRDALVGMNAVVMDEAEVGEQRWSRPAPSCRLAPVAAGHAERGTPARVLRELRDGVAAQARPPPITRNWPAAAFMTLPRPSSARWASWPAGPHHSQRNTAAPA